MNSKPKQSKNWCFTSFQVHSNLTAIYTKNKDIIRYICWGIEIAPTTGKEHFQGWVQFTSKRRMGGVKRILEDNKIHLESCRGSPSANSKYCAKDNKFVEYGKYINQGQRTDLEMIYKQIKSGANKGDIMDSDFSTYCRYRNGINDAIEYNIKQTTGVFRKLNVEYFYGDTDTGKTRTAVETYPEAFKIHASNLKWFDGYEQEKTLIIDEYNNDVNITKILGILDGYKLRLAIKGGHTYANWNKVIITSNLNPDEVHTNAKPQHIKAFWRRIHSRKEFKKIKNNC